MASDKLPTVKTLRKLLSEEGLSAAQWMEIGTQLELKHSTLKEIEYSYPRSPENCLLEVLHCWLRNQKTTPTLEEFKIALR